MWCGILFGRIRRKLTGIVRSQFVYFAKRVSSLRHPLRNVSCEDDRLEIPDAIKSNKSLCRMQRNVYCPIHSKRFHSGTVGRHASAVCRAATLRKLATFLAKSYIFRLCLTILVILCWWSENAGSNAKCFLVYKKDFLLHFESVS